jgi:hypothetical protein
MIHFVDNDHVNLENVEALVLSLEKAYGDPDHMDTAERLPSKLHQGN